MSANQSSSRQWVIEPAYDADGTLLASLSQQLAFRLERLAIVVEDIGGTIGVVAKREEVDRDVFVTTSAVVRWESFAPAQRRPREVPKPTPEPEAEVEDSVEEPVEEPEPAAA